MIGELIGTLADWRECGDLRGHLAALWAVIVGRVTPEDRPELATSPQVAEGEAPPDLTPFLALWDDLSPESQALLVRLIVRLARATPVDPGHVAQVRAPIVDALAR